NNDSALWKLSTRPGTPSWRIGLRKDCRQFHLLTIDGGVGAENALDWNPRCDRCGYIIDRYTGAADHGHTAQYFRRGLHQAARSNQPTQSLSRAFHKRCKINSQILMPDGPVFLEYRRQLERCRTAKTRYCHPNDEQALLRSKRTGTLE